jgi:hypothetical protein
MKSSEREIYQTKPNRLLLTRENAEAMCTQKLRKIQGNLCQTVLVRNTLKYIQTSQYVSLHGESEFVEYEPPTKKHCPESSIVDDVDMNDIDDILSEMFLPHPLIPPDEDGLSFAWPMRESLSRA